MKISEGLKTLLKYRPRPYVGICSNFELVSDSSSDVLENGISTWSGLNGCTSCPVEGNYGDYACNNRKWDKRTKFGKRRHELLNHLIKFYEGIGE